MAYQQSITRCNKWDCAGFDDGNCICLIDNNFGKRECPFYNTKEQAAKEQAYCAERIKQIGIKKKENELC